MTIYLLISNAIIIALGVTVVVQRIKLNRAVKQIRAEFNAKREAQTHVVEQIDSLRANWPKGIL